MAHNTSLQLPFQGIKVAFFYHIKLKCGYHLLGRGQVFTSLMLELNPCCFCSMKRQRVLIPPWMRCLSIARLHPPPPLLSILSPVPMLYTWVERDNMQQSYLSKRTTQWQRSGSKHRPSGWKSVCASFSVASSKKHKNFTGKLLMALCSGSPVILSQTTVVSLWFVIPTAKKKKN